MCTHLAKRGSVYYYRRKTPVELVSIYGKEVMKSLGTKDRKQAEILVRKLGGQYDELFSQSLTESLKTTAQSSDIPNPQEVEINVPTWDYGFTIEDSDLYAALYLRRLKASREKAFEAGRLVEFSTFLNLLINEGTEFLETGNHPFEDNPKELWKIDARIRAARTLKSNGHIDMPNQPKAALNPSSVSISYTSSSKSQTLLHVIDKWAVERKPAARTISMTKTIINQFHLVVGNIELKSITKQHAVAFKDSLNLQGFSASNAKKYIRMLNTLLNFAVAEAMLDSNPARGVSIRESKTAKAKRLPFDLASLNKIFGSGIYTRGERPSGGKGEAAYWIPLLGLFTGARLNEICQLHTRDIATSTYLDKDNIQQEVWVINITNEGDGQTIKNEGSKRIVPVHQELINLGLIDYLQSLPSGLLFPEITPAKTFDSISANWSKWFNRYLRETIKIEDKRLVFHSFRHTFKDYARNSRISTEVHHALTGHSSGNVGDNYGGVMYPLRPLAESMQMYQIQGFLLKK